MNRTTILAATLVTAIGLSPLAANATTHKKHHHMSHAMSKGSMSKGSMNGEQSGTTGMSNSQRTPSGDKSMAPNGMPNNTSGGTGPNARGTNGE